MLQTTLKRLTDADFKALTYLDAPLLANIIAALPSRQCDYTMGGLFMWSEYFGNEFAMLSPSIAVLRGRIPTRSVDNLGGRVIYSYVAAGEVSQDEHRELLRYATERDGELFFFPIALSDARYISRALGEPTVLEEHKFWFDYIYRAEDLIVLSGNRFHGQKNHVNRFLKTYPQYELHPITASDVSALREFLDEIDSGEKDGLATYEHGAVYSALGHLDVLRFDGLVLRVDGRIVAFTLGEYRNGMLYVHVEKARRDVRGAYAFIANSFVRCMKEKHPELHYVNREDDSCDPGLREAKMALHPCELLTKWMMGYS